MRKVIPKNAMTIPPQAERVFKGVIYDVYHWQQEMFDGSYVTFERLKRPDTVQVIAVKDDGVVIQEQRQPNWKSAKYDIPGGRHDVESENELQAIQRELYEETGMVFKEWKLLSAVQPAEKVDHLVYVFLATGFTAQDPVQLDNGEEIKTYIASLEEAKKLLGSEKGRHYPNELAKATSLDDILALPEFKE